MPQATIEVQFVNPPKEGYSSGSIKAKFPNGESGYIEVNADQLSQFVKGGTYSVFWLDKTRRTTGKAYKAFQEFTSKPADPPRASVPPADYKTTLTAPKKATDERFEKPSQEMGMFVMGCVGRAMGSGCFTADNIYELTIAARKAWEQVMEGKAISEALRQTPIVRAATKPLPTTPGNIPESDFTNADDPFNDDPPVPDENAYGAQH